MSYSDLSYDDPENLTDLVLIIKNCKTMGDVKKLIDEVFPTLFITTMDFFCNDYPHLTTNCHALCDKVPTTPKQIIILDNYGDNCVLVKAFAECFTTAGFAVRRKCEFFPCEKCGAAMPSEYIYNLFVEKKFKVPSQWSHYCTSCDR